MKTTSLATSLWIAALAAGFSWVVLLYPERRVCTWFEFMTDGLAPAPVAHVVQDTLAKQWVDGFGRGIADPRGEVSAAVAAYLARPGSDDGGVAPCLVELAAGGGAAPVILVEKVRALAAAGAASSSAAANRRLGATKVLLTDIQPNPVAWAELKASPGGRGAVEFVGSSVDATNLAASLPSPGSGSGSSGGDGGDDGAWRAACLGDGGLRSIHVALHHFGPSLMEAVVSDAVRTNSALLIGDVSPTRGSVLWLAALGFSYGVTPARPGSVSSVEVLRRMVAGLPWWGWLVLPLLPFATWHDGTVSALRAYSSAELLAAADKAAGLAGNETGDKGKGKGMSKYTATVFMSGSFGEWLGLPAWAQALPGTYLNDPVIQWVLLAPTERGAPEARH
jgi:hypothetical protein